MTTEELYNLLPEGSFYIEFALNTIREYDPHKRFPTAKFHLYEILNPWYTLVLSHRVESDGLKASKVK